VLAWQAAFLARWQRKAPRPSAPVPHPESTLAALHSAKERGAREREAPPVATPSTPQYGATRAAPVARSPVQVGTGAPPQRAAGAPPPPAEPHGAAGPASSRQLTAAEKILLARRKGNRP
jgi:hypothetical protein